MFFGKKLQPGIWKNYVNKYTLSLACFLVWICFFDRNNFFTQIRLKSVISDLETQKVRYEKLYDLAKVEKQLLESDKEKYAREKYFMHKENEEVFLIKKKEDQ